MIFVLTTFHVFEIVITTCASVQSFKLAFGELWALLSIWCCRYLTYGFFVSKWTASKHAFLSTTFKYAWDNIMLLYLSFLVNGFVLFMTASLNPRVHFGTLRSFFLLEQCPGTSSRYDHTSWFLRLQFQGSSYALHFRLKFSWGWIRTTDNGVNRQESYHSALLTF